MAKLAKNKSLPPSRRLLINSWRQAWMWRRLLLPVVLLASLVNLLLGLSGDQTGPLYQSLWSVFTVAALIWTIRHAADKSVKVNLSQAFYIGTSPVLKLMLTSVVVGLTLLPFGFGLLLFNAVNLVTAGEAKLWEQLIGVGLWAAFALLSLYFVSRLLFAIMIVTLPNFGPMASLATSWRISQGKALAIGWRLAVFATVTLLITSLPLLVLGLIGVSTGLSQLATGLVANLLVLPLFLIYLSDVYKELR